MARKEFNEIQFLQNNVPVDLCLEVLRGSEGRSQTRWDGQFHDPRLFQLDSFHSYRRRVHSAGKIERDVVFQRQ